MSLIKRKGEIFINYIYPSDMFELSNEIIEKNLEVFLCDDSQKASDSKIISSPNFNPESFTIRDRILKPHYLNESEANFDKWCDELIFDQLNRISSEEQIKFYDIKETESIIRKNLQLLLCYEEKGVEVQDKIWNQEFVDVLRHVIGYSFTGDPSKIYHTHKRFNDLAKEIIPLVISEIEKEKLDLSTILKLGIISGMSGLDLKGTSAASSLYSNSGIQMESYFHLTAEESAQVYIRELKNRLNCPTPVFYWEKFLSEVKENNKLKIVWFTDDYIESFFDLLFIGKLLDEYLNVELMVIPKNGNYGNDASYSDIVDLLNLDTPKHIFDNLNMHKKSGRFSICKLGPRMGTINLRKLSDEAIDLIEDSDLVVIKGCRSHEMVQGGLNKPSFSMFIVSREFSERTTGFDAKESPLLLIYLSPGEYAFYGFKSINLSEKASSDDRKTHYCKSTLKDHEKRQKITDSRQLVIELQNLLEDLLKENYKPELKEISLMLSQLSSNE